MMAAVECVEFVVAVVAAAVADDVAAGQPEFVGCLSGAHVWAREAEGTRAAPAQTRQCDLLFDRPSNSG